MNKIFKKIPKVTYTIISLAALAAVNYTIIHTNIVFIIVFILLAHELGHYFTAKKHKAKASLPIFIPLPFIAIGITKVKDISKEGSLQTALNGPVFGFIASLVLLFFNIIFKFTSNITLIIIALSEIVLNYFGSDGSKYRKIKKDLSCHTF